MTVQVSHLFTYPLKSAAALSLEKAVLTPSGFLNDRIFVAVDSQNQVLTGRENPKLIRISAYVESGKLFLNQPEAGCLTLDLKQAETLSTSISLFKSTVSGMYLGDEAAQWITKLLGISAKLFALSKNIPITAENCGSNGDIKTYTDVSPIHLISQASLDDLNRRLQIPVSIDRFRPNIVVKGCGAYAEDGWQTIKINDCLFEMHNYCRRCVFTTIDPKTGERNSNGEPLKTLATYRKGNGGVNFGIYLIPRKTGTIHLGDRINVALVH